MTDDLKQLHAAPKTIYLQVDPEGVGPSEWDTLDGATWCAEQINDNDVCYVRSDRIEQLEAERDELKADATRLNYIEQLAERSRSGVTIDYAKYVEDGRVLERGYRISWFHHLGDREKTLRKAIDTAIAKGGAR